MSPSSTPSSRRLRNRPRSPEDVKISLGPGRYAPHASVISGTSRRALRSFRTEGGAHPFAGWLGPVTDGTKTNWERCETANRKQPAARRRRPTMKRWNEKLLSTTILPAVLVAGIGVGGVALMAEVNPAPAQAASACGACNPCNPCAASACNPCNPCAAAACNPCNPCAAAACNPCNPCNPCAGGAAAASNKCAVPRLMTASLCNPCNPCNPCAASACNPCNPCAAAACNPCNPCAAAACNP